MTNKSAIRGSKWERDGLAYLRSRALLAERLARAGSKDEGDLVFTTPITKRPVVVEAKALRAFDLAAAIKELKVEVEHYADARGIDRDHVQGVAFIKAPGKGVSQGYAVMTIEEFLRWTV